MTSDEKRQLLTELRSLQAEKATLTGNSSGNAGVGDYIKGSIKQGLPAPFKMASDMADMAPEGRRALMTGAGTEIGSMASPVGAGVGAMAGGMAADLADNPDAMLKGADIAASQVLAPNEVTGKVVDAARNISADDLTNFAKKRAGEFVGGVAAGTIAKGIRSVKATSPFTAGVNSPSTALPGTFEAAGKALGAAKTAAGAGIDSAEVDQILTQLENPKTAPKLLTEARKWAMAKSGLGRKEVSTAKLIAYKALLGETQGGGGEFADVYAQGAKRAAEKLTEKAPELSEKLAAMHTNFVARGNPKASFPWFTLALNPGVGVAKAATLPSVMNVAGAGTRLATEAGAPLAGSKVGRYIIEALNNAAAKRKKGEKK